MRIFKYILLLFLLASIAFSVFVATQPSKFITQRSLEINATPADLFAYVNEYKNWQDWSVWHEEDTNISFNFSQKTSGKDAFYIWKGDKTSGKIKTERLVSTDSIIQKITFEKEKQAQMFWHFKPTKKGTLVTWGMKGELDFMWKMFAVLSGGVDNMMENMLEKGLEDVNQNAVAELQNFDIKINGFYKTDTLYYYKKDWECPMKNVKEHIKTTLTELYTFKNERKIKTSGEAFIKYYTWDEANNVVKYATCLPINNLKSDTIGLYTIEMTKPYMAYKVTATGHTKHLRKAWDKAFARLDKDGLRINEKGNFIEIYKKNFLETRKPTQWITEIVLPVKPKFYKPKSSTTTNSENSVTEPAQPEPSMSN